MNWMEDWDRARGLRRLLHLLLIALAGRVLYQILAEYGSYFPADFESAFLTGREGFFNGHYRVSFYSHIVSGPIVLVLGFCLMFSGLRGRFRRTHRYLGWIHVVLVAGVVAPTGFVMAMHAYTGPAAGLGFALQSLATATSAIATAWFARNKQFPAHRLWATRCFILLCSPLLLRLMSGAVIVAGVESEFTYRLSAWTSWIVALTIHESWRRMTMSQT